MDFNDNQRMAIDSRENLVVSAGAGSGKTAVLSERFLSLVEEGRAHVDEILTITFTRKATAEMKGRIYSRLVEMQRIRPELATEIKRFPFSTISTIDSFCSSIVRSGCVRYGFTSDFTVLDDFSFRDEVFDMAKSFIDSSKGSAAIRTLVKRLGADTLISIFTDMALHHFDISRPVDSERTVEAFLALAKSEIDRAKGRLSEIWHEMEKLLSGKKNPNVEVLKAHLANLESGIFDRPDELIFDLRRGGRQDLDVFRSFRDEIYALSARIFMCGGIMNSKDYYKEIYSLVSRFEERVTDRKRQMGALSFADIVKLSIDILSWDKELRAKYKKRYKFIMIDEFQDNNEDCKNLLYLLAEKNGMEVDLLPERDDLDGGKIFLVGDEKQSIYGFRGADVSVFKRLSVEMGRCLELDVNYRSEAELVMFFNSVFSRVMGPPEAGKPLYEADFKPLGHKKTGSVRSRIIFNNYVIPKDQESSSSDSAETPGVSKGFTNGRDGSLGDVTQHIQLSAGFTNGRDGSLGDVTPELGVASGARKKSTEGAVSNSGTETEAGGVGDKDEDDDATAVQGEAYSIACLVRRMLDSDDFLIVNDSGGKTRPRESDIAILFAKSSHQNEYEKALRLQGIKYTVSEAKGLAEEAVFNDFYSALQLVLYPDDGVSLLSFLKGPLCRVPDSEIPGLFVTDDNQKDVKGAGTGRDAVTPSRWGSESLYTENNLSGQFKETILALREKAATSTLTELLDYVYYNMGYREFLITNPANQVYVEHYDYLFSLAGKFDRAGRGLSEFLDYIRPLLGDSQKVEGADVLQEDSDGVNIMTIHRSKGLGFPIVIVADMGSVRERNASSVDVWDYPEIGAPFFSSIDTYDYRSGHKGPKFCNPIAELCREKKSREHIAELKRLFYVAATRAKYHLVFSACMRESYVEGLGEKTEPESMLDMFLMATDFDFEKQAAVLDCMEDGFSTKIIVEGLPFGRIPESRTYSTMRLSRQALEKNGAWYRGESETFEHFLEGSGIVAATRLERAAEADGEGVRLRGIESDRVIKAGGYYTEFGTLCHAYIENFINGTDSMPVFEKSSELDGSALSVLHGDASSLAEAFIESEVFSRIKDWNLLPEKEFYMYDDDSAMIVSGRIDLLALKDDEAVILDFKSDGFKNPGEYERQILSYKKAVSLMFPDKKVSAAVVYLRDAGNPVWI